MPDTPTATVHADGGRVTIVIDIPPALWTGNEGIDRPATLRRFDGTLVINGTPMHLQAMQVETLDGLQCASSLDCVEDLNRLYEINGNSSPFATSRTVAAGAEFLPFAVAYED